MSLQKKKMLIVDDQEIGRDLLKTFFEDKYEIIEAVNGEEAIEKIKEHGLSLSIILLDILMPKVDGMEVLQYMNDYNYIGSVPVILITGDDSMGQEVKAFDLGASDFINKPFIAAVVVKRVQNIVDLFERNRELRQMVEEQNMTIYEQSLGEV